MTRLGCNWNGIVIFYCFTLCFVIEEFLNKSSLSDGNYEPCPPPTLCKFMQYCNICANYNAHSALHAQSASSERNKSVRTLTRSDQAKVGQNFPDLSRSYVPLLLESPENVFFPLNFLLSLLLAWHLFYLKYAKQIQFKFMTIWKLNTETLIAQ